MNTVNLIAKTKYGFFGLNELHNFFLNSVDTSFNNNSETELVLDFSSVNYWDISALLWLIVALDHYMGRNKIEDKQNRFKFSLPKPVDLGKSLDDMTDNELNRQRSLDYLRRWKFYNALSNIDEKPERFFSEGQKNTINCDPQVYFTKNSVMIDGLYKELISVNLLEISNLVDLRLKKDNRKISKENILKFLSEYIDKAICPILANTCGIKKETANMFVTHLLYESLANSLQHPNADIGMFSISKIGTDKLVLSIVDNGEAIPETIYKHFQVTYQNTTKATLPENYSREKLSETLRAKIISHATKKGVSRKYYMKKNEWEDLSFNGSQSNEVGVGLTHIRDATTKDFCGNLIIAADGVSVKFKTPSETQIEPKVVDYNFPWPGNLLRIQIPINKNQ